MIEFVALLVLILAHMHFLYNSTILENVVKGDSKSIKAHANLVKPFQNEPNITGFREYETIRTAENKLSMFQWTGRLAKANTKAEPWQYADSKDIYNDDFVYPFGQTIDVHKILRPPPKKTKEQSNLSLLPYVVLLVLILLFVVYRFVKYK